MEPVFKVLAKTSFLYCLLNGQFLCWPLNTYIGFEKPHRCLLSLSGNPQGNVEEGKPDDTVRHCGMFTLSCALPVQCCAGLQLKDVSVSEPTEMNLPVSQLVSCVSAQHSAFVN